jgi:hypothetical protein
MFSPISHLELRRKSVSQKKPWPVAASVARWFVFKPKFPILVKFGGPWIRKCCYIL